MLVAAYSCVLKVLQAPRYREPHASRRVCLSPCSCAMDCWFSNSLFVPSSCIEVKRIFALVWGALELWVRGVPDDGNDHSSNKLSVLKALTCFEGQSALIISLTLVPSSIVRIVSAVQ